MAGKLFTFLLLAFMLLLQGCCVKQFRLAPSFQKNKAQQAKNTTIGGELCLQFDQCPTARFKAAWNALNEEKIRLNKQFRAGEISSDEYQAAMAKIDKLAEQVLNNLQGVTVVAPTAKEKNIFAALQRKMKVQKKLAEADLITDINKTVTEIRVLTGRPLPAAKKAKKR